jgi:YVTN family beta-propeller protein
MIRTALSSQRAAAAGIMLAISSAVLWPRPVADGGDAAGSSRSPGTPASSPDEPHRSPIALALSADGSRLLVANQTAGTVALLDTKAARVVDEVKTGEKPSGVALSKDGRRGVVAHW